MSSLIAHRGPDDAGLWTHERGHVGLAHRRLSIIDLEHRPPADDRRAQAAGSPTTARSTTTPSCARELGADRFRTTSDTEVVLRAYERWGADGLDRLRGMFAYALWDEPTQELVCARDRFGIKPFYYATVGDVVYFASEAEGAAAVPALDRDRPRCAQGLPRVPVLPGRQDAVQGRPGAPARPLPEARPGRRPSRSGTGRSTTTSTSTTPSGTSRSSSRRCCASRSSCTCAATCRSAYLSGGLDSSVVASLASAHTGAPMQAFTGKFSEDERYDESRYARAAGRVARPRAARDRHRRRRLRRPHRRVVYHLDFPVAGPGSFPQFMVSAGGEPPLQGGPRRAGRRRDLRRLRALPGRLLRAVHQGGDRRHDARRQLRRHLRVDHPQPRRAAELQADAPGVLARAACSRTSTPATSA